MAWEKSHATTVRNLDRRDVWRVWQDVGNWHLWDDDIEYAKLDAPFRAGNHFILKPKGGPKVRIELAKVEENAGFTDLTRFPLARMYGEHSMRETPAGLEVKHVMRIEGPLAFLWRKLVAEKVAAGLDVQSEKMIARARELAVAR